MLREQFKYMTSKGFVLAFSAGLSSLLGFLVIFVFGHVGTEGGYGVYSYVLTVTSLTGITALSGMNVAIVVAAAQGKTHILRTASRRRMKFSLLFGCPILLAAGLVMALFYPKFALAGYACLILVPVFPFMYSCTGVYNYLIGRKEFELLAFAQIFAAFLNLATAFIALLFWPDFPVIPPVVVLATKTLFEAGLYLFLVRRDRIPLLDADAHLVQYGMKVTLTGATGNVESYLDRFIVGTVYGFHDLGVYNAGRSVILPLKQIPQIYYQLYLPKLAQKRPGEAWRLTNRALFWVSLLFVPGLAVLFWLLPWFYTTFMGKFAESSTYARGFLLVVAVGIPWNLYGTLLESQRQARREIMVRATRTILIALGLLIFIQFFGIMGAVYAEILATAAMSLHSWYEARKSRNVE